MPQNSRRLFILRQNAARLNQWNWKLLDNCFGPKSVKASWFGGKQKSIRTLTGRNMCVSSLLAKSKRTQQDFRGVGNGTWSFGIRSAFCLLCCWKWLIMSIFCFDKLQQYSYVVFQGRVVSGPTAWGPTKKKVLDKPVPATLPYYKQKHETISTGCRPNVQHLTASLLLPVQIKLSSQEKTARIIKWHTCIHMRIYNPSYTMVLAGLPRKTQYLPYLYSVTM